MHNYISIFESGDTALNGVIMSIMVGSYGLGLDGCCVGVVGVIFFSFLFLMIILTWNVKGLGRLAKRAVVRRLV